jgi:YD repeat-containing protein
MSMRRSMNKRNIAREKRMTRLLTSKHLRASACMLPLWLMFTGVAQAQVPSTPADYSRTSAFTYRADGLLQSETVEPGLPQSCVVTTHEYDTQGNRIKSTTANCSGATGNALFTSRASSSQFAAQSVTINGVAVSIPAGTFATTGTNALNQSETRKHDPRFGAVIEVTGPNALTTKAEYDDFGRKVRTLAADGTSVRPVRGTCAPRDADCQ